MKRVVIAFLVGPLIAVPLLLFLISASTILFADIGMEMSLDKICADLENTITTVKIGSYFGVPIAYLCTAVLGAPYYVLLKKNNDLCLEYFILGAFVIGTLAASIIERTFNPFMGVFGAWTAFVIWHLGARPTNENV